MTVTKEAAHLMGEACRITRDLVALHPVKPDVFPNYMAVQAWPLVAPLYHGVEQALKMLLLTPSDPRFSLPQLRQEYGHDLKRLYSELEADDRGHIELHFQEHWSLYTYDTYGAAIVTAEQFIAQINGTTHAGSIAWRYFLIDESVKIPAVSLLTMSEIWDAICCLIRRDVFDKQDDCYRLSRRLLFELDDLRYGRVVPYDDYLSDTTKWCVHMNGDQLATWVDLLVKAQRNAINDVQAPDRLKYELAKMASEALQRMASDSADPDEAMLLHRIQNDPNLAWDPIDGVFR